MLIFRSSKIQRSLKEISNQSIRIESQYDRYLSLCDAISSRSANTHSMFVTRLKQILTSLDGVVVDFQARFLGGEATQDVNPRPQKKGLFNVFFSNQSSRKDESDKLERFLEGLKNTIRQQVEEATLLCKPDAELLDYLHIELEQNMFSKSLQDCRIDAFIRRHKYKYLGSFNVKVQAKSSLLEYISKLPDNLRTLAYIQERIDQFKRDTSKQQPQDFDVSWAKDFLKIHSELMFCFDAIHDLEVSVESLHGHFSAYYYQNSLQECISSKIAALEQILGQNINNEVIAKEVLGGSHIASSIVDYETLYISIVQ